MLVLPHPLHDADAEAVKKKMLEEKSEERETKCMGNTMSMQKFQPQFQQQVLVTYHVLSSNVQAAAVAFLFNAAEASR